MPALLSVMPAAPFVMPTALSVMPAAPPLSFPTFLIGNPRGASRGATRMKGQKEKTGFPLKTCGNDSGGTCGNDRRGPGISSVMPAAPLGHARRPPRSCPLPPLSFPTFLIGNPEVSSQSGDTRMKGQKEKTGFPLETCGNDSGGTCANDRWVERGWQVGIVGMTAGWIPAKLVPDICYWGNLRE